MLIAEQKVSISNAVTNNETERAKRLFGPDLSRAAAILCVVLSHTFPGATTFVSVKETRSVLGFVGVEIFFILSGYLVGGILLKQLFEGTVDSVRGLSGFWK